MRLWSIHPKYLDVKGLLAVWREGLLARRVLEGRIKGYRSHPQLERFKKSGDPILYINAYLYQIFLEAERRGYSFDESKIKVVEVSELLPVTEKQVEYEFRHLLNKLKRRAEDKYEELKDCERIEVNPIFKIIPGGVEPWERI